MKKNYDVIIIGGGVVGAGIFRDAALHGLSCLILDKKDFTSQTSQSSSKMLHGGIRYLETMDFDLVWEALHEKNLWLKIAPHLCQEKSFIMPVYDDSLRPLWMLKAGLWLYDLLSSFENTPHKIISKEETLRRLPMLRSQGLKGGGVYSDAIVEDAKLTLEVIYDGLLETGSEALSYHEFTGFQEVDGKFHVQVLDHLSGTKETYTADDLVFALGPFTDQVLSKFPDLNWTHKLLPSKGSHIWVDQQKLPVKNPLVMTPSDGRVIFVIPQRGAVLVGTTEVKIEGEIFDLKISKDETHYLLNNLNEYFPDANIKEADILSSFAGVRPLVKDESSSELGKTARDHKCFWPKSNIHVILGGKYTTFRTMAQDIVQNLLSKRYMTYSRERTKRPLRQVSTLPPFQKITITKDHLVKILETEKPRTFQDLVMRRMGISGKKHWVGHESFDDFFKLHFETINNYISINLEEIENYP